MRFTLTNCQISTSVQCFIYGKNIKICRKGYLRHQVEGRKRSRRVIKDQPEQVFWPLSPSTGELLCFWRGENTLDEGKGGNWTRQQDSCVDRI